MARCSEGARSRFSDQGKKRVGTEILGGQLVRLAEAQEFWSTGGEAGIGQTTDYE